MLTQNNLSCGLDFGTSNSVISLTNTDTGEEVFTFSLQSILYFPEADHSMCYIGKEAEQRYVEEGMKGRLLKSVKTLLKQDKFLFTWIGGRRVTPDQLATYIISKLKEKAEAFTGFSIEKVVLGRPAVFSEKKEEEETAVKRLILAGKNAGFKEIHLQMEPIAAALSYEKKLTKEETVLVADFGGGTSDFTIIRLSPTRAKARNRQEDILAHGGVYIGGDIFDSEIMWHKVTPLLGRGVCYKSYDKMLEVPNTLYRELRNWERSFLLKESKARRQMDKFYIFASQDPRINNVRVLIDNNYVYSLFKEIERSKITLSKEDTSTIKFSKENIDLQEDMQFCEFEKIIGKHLNDIKLYLKNMMEESKFTTDMIDSVYLTGGSSLSKPIRNIFYDIFGKERVNEEDTFHSVAHGLSLNYV